MDVREFEMVWQEQLDFILDSRLLMHCSHRQILHEETIPINTLCHACNRMPERPWKTMVEPSKAACSYRGELVGLIAIHLLLLAVNENHPLLQGSVHIYSDCLGALEKVKIYPH